MKLIERLMTTTAIVDEYWDNDAEQFVIGTHPTIDEIRQLARELMLRHGLPLENKYVDGKLVQKAWTFDFITNRKKGNIAFCNSGRKEIRFNTRFVFAMEKSEIIDTLLHEIAHALCDMRHGHRVQAHGREWREICYEVGCRARATVRLRSTFGFNEDWVLDVGVNPFHLITNATLNKANNSPALVTAAAAFDTTVAKRKKPAENATKKAWKCYNNAVLDCTDDNCMELLYTFYVINMQRLGYKQAYIDYQYRLIQRGDLSLAERKKMV